MDRLSSKSRRNRKKILLIGYIFLLLVAGILVYSYINKGGIFANQESVGKTEGTIDLNRPTKQQIQAGKDVKSTSALNSNKDTSRTDDTTSTGKNNVGVILSSVNQSSGTLVVRTLINKVTTFGVCTLSMTNDRTADRVSVNSRVQALPSSTTCQGFEVPLNSLSSSKTWNLKITFSDDSSQGEVSMEISLQT